MLRDVPLAEELTQDALVAALEHWPATGVPEKPGAWLMATAKRRALDHLRRGQMLARKHEMLARDMEQEQQAMPDFDAALDDDIGDEMLRLIFTACHPLLSREARAALALRMICGLTTEEIARAFLVPEATIAQRIVRAKRTLSESGLAYETPRGEELSERLASVLEVVYLIFNEGYTAARGDELAAAAALQRGAAHGARADVDRAARAGGARATGADGAERLAQRRAYRCGGRARPADGPEPRALGPPADPSRPAGAARGLANSAAADGFYALQAAIIACHAAAASAEETDWQRISELYAELAALVPSPVIELNRAVAVGMAEGPGAGLAIADRLVGEPALKSYHLLGSVRGDLLHKLGRFEEARMTLEAAADLATNGRERELLRRRASEAAEAASRH